MLSLLACILHKRLRQNYVSVAASLALVLKVNKCKAKNKRGRKEKECQCCAEPKLFKYLSVICSISKFSIHPFLNLAPGISSCTLPHNPPAAIVFFLGSFSLTTLQNARNKFSSQDKDSECLENVSAAVLSGVVPALLISPAWGLKWEPSGQPSSRRGSDSVCWLHLLLC